MDTSKIDPFLSKLNNLTYYRDAEFSRLEETQRTKRFDFFSCLKNSCCHNNKVYRSNTDQNKAKSLYHKLYASYERSGEVLTDNTDIHSVIAEEISGLLAKCKNITQLNNHMITEFLYQLEKTLELDSMQTAHQLMKFSKKSTDTQAKKAASFLVEHYGLRCQAKRVNGHVQDKLIDESIDQLLSQLHYISPEKIKSTTDIEENSSHDTEKTSGNTTDCQNIGKRLAKYEKWDVELLPLDVNNKESKLNTVAILKKLHYFSANQFLKLRIFGYITTPKNIILILENPNFRSLDQFIAECASFDDYLTATTHLLQEIQRLHELNYVFTKIQADNIKVRNDLSIVLTGLQNAELIETSLDGSASKSTLKLKAGGTENKFYLADCTKEDQALFNILFVSVIANSEVKTKNDHRKYFSNPKIIKAFQISSFASLINRLNSSSEMNQFPSEYILNHLTKNYKFFIKDFNRCVAKIAHY